MNTVDRLKRGVPTTDDRESDDDDEEIDLF